MGTSEKCQHLADRVEVREALGTPVRRALGKCLGDVRWRRPLPLEVRASGSTFAPTQVGCATLDMPGTSVSSHCLI